MSLIEQIAEEFAASARTAYEKYKEVEPAVMLLSDATNGLLMVPADTTDVPRELKLLAGTLAKVMRVQWIVAITESWMKKLPPNSRQPIRGDLAKEAEAGSTDVFTVVVVSAIEVKEGPPTGLMIMSIPKIEDDGTVTWSLERWPGEMHGSLPEDLLRLCWRAQQDGPDSLPPHIASYYGDLASWAGSVVRGGHASTAMVIEGREP